MSNIAEKLTTIAENQQKLYDKGMSDKESVLWDGILWDGARTTYVEYLFANWKDEYIRPKYKLTPTTTAHHIFYCCRNLKKIEKDYFDFSSVPEVASGVAGLVAAFNGCSNLIEIEDINLSPTTYYQAFANCLKLEKIANINVKIDTYLADAFVQCKALKEVRFTGTIGTNLNFKYSPLSLDSLNNIISHLGTWTSGTHTLTFSEYTKSLITDEMADEITSKGWEYV